jgi:hypothetical protein
MNVDNLNEMAEYFEKGPSGPFNMKAYCDCVIGHSLRHLEKRTGNWNFQWVQGAARRMFGIDMDRNFHHYGTGDFLFGSQWNNDPKAAAFRLRYVARHGGAPDWKQWHNFMTVPEEGQFIPPAVQVVEEEALEEEACLV